MFDNTFTAKILGMWNKRGFTTSHAGVLPSIEPVSQWAISQKTNEVGVGGLRIYFFENSLELLLF